MHLLLEIYAEEGTSEYVAIVSRRPEDLSGPGRSYEGRGDSAVVAVTDAMDTFDTQNDLDSMLKEELDALLHEEEGGE